MPHTVQMTVQPVGPANVPVWTCHDCDWTVSGWGQDIWFAVLDHADPPHPST